MEYIHDSSCCILQEVTAECHGNFYNPASDNCVNKLEKVYRVRIHLPGVHILTMYSIIRFIDVIFTFDHDNSQDIAGLNVYDILEPCYHGAVAQDTIIGNPKLPSGSSFRKLGETEKPLLARKRMFGRAWPFKAPVRDGVIPTWRQVLTNKHVPCTVSYRNYNSLFSFWYVWLLLGMSTW